MERKIAKPTVMTLDLLNEPVSKFTNPKMTIIASNLTVQDAAKAMAESKVDSILVFKKNKIIGIITEKDILYDIVAKGLNPTTLTLKEIVKNPIISINKNAPVREALVIMEKNDIRRLIVMDKRPIGLITQKQVCGSLKENNILLQELEITNKTLCPYCSTKFENNKSLCGHIDKIHISHKK